MNHNSSALEFEADKEVLVDSNKSHKTLSLSESDCDCADCGDCGDCQCGDAGDGSGSGDW